MDLKKLVPYFVQRPVRKLNGGFYVLYRNTVSDNWSQKDFSCYAEAKEYYAKKAEKVISGAIAIIYYKTRGKQNG